jgi:hypothetical protein
LVQRPLPPLVEGLVLNKDRDNTCLDREMMSCEK